MRVADTSLLYAFLDADDRHHERARGLMGAPEPVLVPPEILVETVNLVQYRAGFESARQALGSLTDLPHVSVSEPADPNGLAKVFGQGEGDLSLADAVVVQVCRQTGADPMAFDEAILERVDPASDR